MVAAALLACLLARLLLVLAAARSVGAALARLAGGLRLHSLLQLARWDSPDRSEPRKQPQSGFMRAKSLTDRPSITGSGRQLVGRSRAAAQTLGRERTESAPEGEARFSAPSHSSATNGASQALAGGGGSRAKLSLCLNAGLTLPS